MITIKPSAVRHFIGRLEPGDNLFAGLREFCDENRVKTAWLQGTALVDGLEVVEPSGGQVFAGRARFLDGQWFCPAVTGNISMKDDKIDIRLYGIWHSGRGEIVSGMVTTAMVRMFEFSMLVSDDSVLQRDPLDKGLAAWSNIRPTGKRPERPQQEQPRSTQHETVQERQSPDELAIQLIAEMRQGDFILHPALGKCLIMAVPREGRIRIRMGNGKIAVLNADVLEISPFQVIKGKRIFPVKVKR